MFDSMSADHNFHLDKVILEERRSEHPSAAPGFKPNSPSESQASEYIYPEGKLPDQLWMLRTKLSAGLTLGDPIYHAEGFHGSIN